jgi:hypothetical protein
VVRKYALVAKQVELYKIFCKVTCHLPVEVDYVGGDGDLDRYLEFDLVLFGDEVLVTYLRALLLHYFL